MRVILRRKLMIHWGGVHTESLLSFFRFFSFINFFLIIKVTYWSRKERDEFVAPGYETSQSIVALERSILVAVSASRQPIAELVVTRTPTLRSFRTSPSACYQRIDETFEASVAALRGPAPVAHSPPRSPRVSAERLYGT